MKGRGSIRFLGEFPDRLGVWDEVHVQDLAASAWTSHRSCPLDAGILNYIDEAGA